MRREASGARASARSFCGQYGGEYQCQCAAASEWTYHRDVLAPFAPEPVDLERRQVGELGSYELEKLGLLRVLSVLELERAQEGKMVALPEDLGEVARRRERVW